MGKTRLELLEAITGRQDETPLSSQVLNAVLFASAGVSTLNLVFAEFYDPVASVYALIGASILAFWAMYLWSRLRPESRSVIWIYMAVDFLIVGADFFLIGGAFGLMFPVFIAVSAALPMAAKREQLVGVILGILSFFCILIIATSMRPELVIPFDTDYVSVLVKFAEVGVISVGLLAVTCLTINAYRGKRDLVDRLNEELKKRNTELEAALDEVVTLRGIIPICSSCKKVRNDDGYYEAVEQYVSRHINADFSHTICMDCLDELYPEDAEKIRRNVEEKKK